MRQGAFDLGWVGVALEYPDPESFYYYFSDHALKMGFNLSRYSSEDYNEAFQALTTEMNPKRRFELASKLESILIRDVPAIPVAGHNEIVAAGRAVTDLVPSCYAPVNGVFPLASVKLRRS